MYIKVNEIYGTENLLNLDKVERITSNGAGNSTVWFSQNDADTMVIRESFEEVMLMIHFSKKANGVMD